MIRLTLEPTRLVAGRPEDLTFRFTNLGRGPCTRLVFGLALPAQLVLLRGLSRLERDRLDAGESLVHTVRVRPRQPGRWRLAGVNFSYRDELGESNRVQDPGLELEAVPPEVVPAAPEPDPSGAHESAGRWDLAWPLHRRAGRVERARACLARAVDLLERERRDGEAARQCEGWADLEWELSGRRALGDRELAGWLERAAGCFVLARDPGSAERCREKAARLMEVPRFHLQIVAPADVRFVERQSTLVIVRVANVGYGPAREVRVRLAGDVEDPVERAFPELQVEETREWNTARITPRRAGDGVLRIGIGYSAYRTGQTGQVELEQPFRVAEAGLAALVGQVARSGAPLQLHVEKYVAPGATSNEMHVRDAVVVARKPLFGGVEERG